MEKNTIKSLIITYGILLGILSVLTAVLKFIFASNFFEKNIPESIFGILMTAVLIIIPIRIYKKGNNGFLSLSDALKIGLGMSAIAGVIGIAYFFIFSNYIETDFAKNMFNTEVRKSMDSNPSMTNAQRQQGMEMAKKFMMPMFYTMILISNLFFGFVISLITGLVLRKKV